MRDSPSEHTASEVATELNELVAGASILTMALFPLAVPVLVLVLAPLALLALAGLILAAPFVVPVWIARRITGRRPRARRAAGAPEAAAT